MKQKNTAIYKLAVFFKHLFLIELLYFLRDLHAKVHILGLFCDIILYYPLAFPKIGI